MAAFALPDYARAGAAAPKWHFQWRPNWLPGDPDADPAGLSYPATAFLPATAHRSVSPAAAGSGLFVAIDPVTHKPVMPTLEQRKAWAADAARAAAREAPLAPGAFLPVQRLPGGGEIVHLNGRFQVYEVARRDANGHFTTDCVSDFDAAKKLLKQPAPAKPKREER